ncbi:hypothetical protein [Leadbetterella byssophila]|uniref:hypothetical protein n=1 Tax=Leadbetterella byssophila TaxID=316068 RepID=UPI0039A1ECB6
MGILLGVGAGKPSWAYDYFYGVERDNTAASSACTRIGRSELHQTLPIQSKMRRCLLNDNGTVNYYLDPNDSTKRDTGAAADLTGASGQVMVEIPQFYIKFEVEGTKERAMISEYPLPGFTLVPKMYVSAYEATVDRTISGTPKLCSVVNTTANFRGGNNTAAWDGTYRSLLGMPATNISLTNFRTYARNRGAYGLNDAGWNCYTYDAHKTLFWLYVIEYANLNSQLAYNASPDANGYKQGGLGNGVTTLNSATWTTYNGTNPVIPCGYTNPLGNRTGTVDFALPAEYGTLTVAVPSYRGVENPFGHVWKWTDGLKCRIQSDVGGGLSEFYICENPANYQSANYTNYVLRGLLPRTEGYVKNILFGEYGDMLVRQTGGSSSTYYADYFYTSLPGSGEEQRGVRFGGSANYGASAGLACAYTSYAPSNAGTNIGSRLCFIPTP